MGVKRIDYINALYRTTEDGRVIEGGYLELVPITDLRLTGEYSEKDLQQIAKSAAGSFGNPYQWDYTQDYWAKPSDLGNCPWDDYRVLVLTAEQMSVDNYFYSKNLNKENKPVRREKYGYKSSSSRREAVQEERRNYYQGSWVVGTEFGHGCGPQDTAPRPKLSEARCSLHVIQLDGPSPVEQCEPIFDQVQISWTRYQNNKITAMNSGYAIDEALLVENELGGKMSPAEQIRMARNTGVLLVRSVDARGRSTMSPQSQSIMRMEGGALEAVNEFVTDYNLMVSILGDMTGLTGPAIAQPVDGKKVNELSLEATGTILAPMINGVREIKKSLAKNIILRACLVLKYVDKAREYYTGVLGKDCMDVLMMAVDKNLREYGITVKVTNNSEIIQRLIRSAEMQLEMGRNGQPGLEWIEYAQITRLLIQGASPQYVEALIGRTIDKRKEEMQKAAMEQAKAQPEAQAAAQAQMLQLQMAVEDHKTKNAAELAVTTRAIDYYYTSKENAEAAITAKEQALTDATLETLVAPLLQGAIATAQQRSQMQQPAQ